jgi:hypothetical protein
MKNPPIIWPCAISTTYATWYAAPAGRSAGPDKWHYVAAQLDKAAAGADTADVAIALRIVLSIEGVECRSQ